MALDISCPHTYVIWALELWSFVGVQRLVAGDTCEENTVIALKEDVFFCILWQTSSPARVTQHTAEQQPLTGNAPPSSQIAIKPRKK